MKVDLWCAGCGTRNNGKLLKGVGRHEEDVWTEIAKYLDGKSLVMLAATSKWFIPIVMDESVWNFACLCDLEVPDCHETAFNWIKLYASAFGGSHSYALRQKEKHIDLQLVRCPVCDLNTCDGTMLVLDARHLELFLTEGYQKGSWEYKLVGSHDVRKRVDSASGGIFDLKYLKDPSTAGAMASFGPTCGPPLLR